MIYLQLFYSYLKIGFFGFGGGYAMLSLIQNEVVVQNAWMSNAEFADIVAVAQMTPGPIAINSATYVGYTVAGFWGAVVATISVCLPALTLMILITRFFLSLRRNRYVKGIIAGMRPVGGRPQLHRRLELGALCRRARGVGAQGEPYSADRALGRRGHSHILRADAIRRIGGICGAVGGNAPRRAATRPVSLRPYTLRLSSYVHSPRLSASRTSG